MKTPIAARAHRASTPAPRASASGEAQRQAASASGEAQIQAAQPQRQSQTANPGAKRPAAGGGTGRAIDMTGQRFGQWLVLTRAENIGTKAAWLCRCDCGTERAVMGKNLRRGRSTSCGHATNPGRHDPNAGPGRWAYSEAHKGTRRTRGSAAEHLCQTVGCEEPAAEWAHLALVNPGTHRMGQTGRGYVSPYSTAPSSYLGLCRVHHRALDAWQRRLREQYRPA